MSLIDSYQKFVSDLADREYFGQKLGLERVSTFLENIKNPHRAYPAIHIAGTNGKGSTAAMLASVLKEAGYRVGLYTSPHLEDFCERIQVNGELISSQEVMGLACQLQALEKTSHIELTFFEFTTVMAFQYFADQKVDVAVVEVGLGGRLDATNVVTPEVSVITSIGYDHQAFLGNTLEKIAFEKSGIIKPGVPVVVGDLPLEAEKVIKEVAEEKKCLIISRHGERSRTMNVSKIDASTSSPCPSSNIKLGLSGEHQKINASVVLDVIRLLNQSGRFKICFPDIEQGLASVKWPGRLETISQNPWILLDGAHNVEAMQKVVDYLKVEKKSRRLVCLFGTMGDKNVDEVMAILKPVVDEFVFTQVEGKRAMEARVLKKKFGQENTQIYQTVSEAIEAMLRQLAFNDILLVTGSLYIVGEARTCLKK